MTTVRRYDPKRDEVQRWERSSERNPPSQGRRRAIQRRDQIRADAEREATQDRGGEWPARETVTVA